MIKSALLSRKCKKLIKAQKKEHVTYRSASNFGILYNSQEFNRELVEELADSLKGDGKELAMLAFTEKESEEQFSFCKKDISASGNLNKDRIGMFTRQPFDFLISLDTSGDINYKYVLALSKANCKIGINSEAYDDLLMLAVKPSDNSSTSTQDVLRYLKMI